MLLIVFWTSKLSVTLSKSGLLLMFAYVSVFVHHKRTFLLAFRFYITLWDKTRWPVGWPRYLFCSCNSSLRNVTRNKQYEIMELC